MTLKSLFTPRSAAAGKASADSGAGGIVILMMALVFVPVVAAHAVVLWQDQFGAQQIAAIVSVLLRTF